MKRPFVQLLLAAVLGSLLTLSLPAIAEVATRAASGNADKVDGNHANVLSRVAYSQPDDVLINGRDWTTLTSAHITTPKAGWLIISAGYEFRGDHESFGQYTCHVQINPPSVGGGGGGETIVGDGFQAERCEAFYVLEVPEGVYEVQLGAQANGTFEVWFAQDIYVVVDYVRFDSDGKKSKCTEFPCPVPGVPVEPPGGGGGVG